MGSTFQDTFPLRVKKILIMNPPAIFDAIMKIAKTFSKTKMMDRIEMVSKKDLPKYFDKDNLIEEFGGNLQFSFEKSIEAMQEWVKANEERLIAPGRQTETKKS